MKILIIEDEIPAVNRLKKLLKEVQPDCDITGTVDEVSTAVEWLTTNPTPDLIFMDIQLADGYSFEIFDLIEVSSPVIFVTAFDQFAVNAFRVNGLDYILKPIRKELLIESLDRFKALNNNPIDISTLSQFFKSNNERFKERFLIKSGDELNFVRASEIAYFLSESSYSFIVTKGGNRYIVDLTLDQIECDLDPSLFFRINRKQIICLDCITKISTFFNNRLKLELNPIENSDTIVSRTRVRQFKAWLNE